MLIKIRERKKKKHKSKNIVFLFSFISYSFFLIYFSINKNFILKKVDSAIPLGTRQIIKDSFPYQFYKSGFKPNFINNIIRAYFQDVEPIKLDIKHKKYTKLQEKRNEALNKGVLISTEDDYVNALLTNGEFKFPAKIRLKGDFVDHLSGDKWSYRLKLKDDKTFLGMNKFSLQSPVTRNYLWEWLFHALLRHEGLPSLKYYFRPLIVNGSYRGIYAIEQHFDKILLESNGFKEAPILKFSENLMWDKKVNNLEDEKNYSYKKTFSTAFQLNKIKKNDVLTRNLDTANQLLNGFHKNTFSTSEVFDINMLAKYFAIIDLLNSHHASVWHNIRFYYDPFQSKLIPIGFDGDTNESPLEKLSIQMSDEFRRNIFKDIEFVKVYVQNLSRISERSYLDKFFKINGEDFEKNKNILYKSFPALDTNLESIYKNQQKIRNTLNSDNAINSYLENINSNEIILSIASTQSLPLALKAIKIDDQIFELKEKNLIIYGTKNNDFPTYKKLKIQLKNFKYKKLNKPNNIFLIYQVIGINNDFAIQINNFKNSIPKNVNMYKDNSIDIQKNSFLVVDNDEKTIITKSGNWFVNKPLIIPSNYQFIINSNTNIYLQDRGYILSFGNIKFLGEKDNPIKIININKSLGNGFAIINAKNKSSIENTEFINLSSVNNERFIFTGGVTAYQSEIDFKNVKFKNSISEDSLNLVRSNFIIENISLQNSKSDAIDIDFSNGIINNIKILNSNNDGLDVSGSEIKIKNIYIENSKDKGVSIGEASNIEINSLKINGSFVAIANKDGSKAKISNAELRNSKYDFAGFKKKNEYRGSITQIDKLNISSNKLNYLLAFPSTLEIENNKYSANSKNNLIFNLLYKEK